MFNVHKCAPCIKILNAHMFQFPVFFKFQNSIWQYCEIIAANIIVIILMHATLIYCKLNKYIIIVCMRTNCCHVVTEIIYRYRSMVHLKTKFLFFTLSYGFHKNLVYFIMSGEKHILDIHSSRHYVCIMLFSLTFLSFYWFFLDSIIY